MYDHGQTNLERLVRSSSAVTTADAKAQCRVDTTADDATIDGFVSAATDVVEDTRDRTVMWTTWRLTLDGFPGSLYGVPVGRFEGDGTISRHLLRGAYLREHETITLRRGPVLSVQSVAYINTAGVLTTLDPSLYQVDLTGLSARVLPAYSQTWPATRSQAGAVTINYTAGYLLAASVPDKVKLAIKVITAWLYENRGDGQAAMPQAAEWLLSSFGSGHNY